MYSKSFISKKIVIYQIISFVIIILLIWFDEIIDIPYYLLGASKTPVNWRESFLETLLIIIIGLFTIFSTIKILNRILYLEGILPVCSNCKKIRNDEGQWCSIEKYISKRTEANFSHGLCPNCLEELYPDYHNSEDNID